MLDVGFPDSSVGTESTCNAGDPGLIPGLGRSPWRKDRLPIPVFWASLVAQKVKNPPAMLETWVRSLGWEDPQEKGMATYSCILAWRIPWTEEPGGQHSMASQRFGHDWAHTHVHILVHKWHHQLRDRPMCLEKRLAAWWTLRAVCKALLNPTALWWPWIASSS